MTSYDFVIVGGGIVGLSTAMALTERFPGAGVLLVEKEDRWAAHQTGRNSGVIHSGIYYRPGTSKAELVRRGKEELVDFCRHFGIAHELCGKIIVATNSAELSRLRDLQRRGIANGLSVRVMGREEMREIEPHVEGVGALHVPGAGIVDYRAVAETFVEIIQERGGELRLRTTVRGLAAGSTGVLVESDSETFQARTLINCAGLHSDRIARLAGVRLQCRIVPFRGEYYELRTERRHLVKHLVYPVPNPAFPFLGVHFTRMIHGGVHAGPNAVLAFRREGYRKRDVGLRDLMEVLGFPGFWKLALPHWRVGLLELLRSISKQMFVRSLQRLVPEITAEDLVDSPSGVRAQALGADGRLLEDFLIVNGRRSIHVCNAPSPAATASISIGQTIVERIASADPPGLVRVAS